MKAWHFAAASMCLLLAACSPPEPLKIGFVGGLSDRNSDVGQAGQNGVILAIEQVNRSGGINGRKLDWFPATTRRTAKRRPVQRLNWLPKRSKR